jgi:N-terminal half of MaoC dehydratase
VVRLGGRRDGRRPPGGEGGGIGLHAEQRFEYHRPLRAGDVLRWSRRPGASYEKAGRRGGRLRFQEHVTEFRDAAGELVVTSIAVSVLAEKTVGEEA